MAIADGGRGVLHPTLPVVHRAQCPSWHGHNSGDPLFFLSDQCTYSSTH